MNYKALIHHLIGKCVSDVDRVLQGAFHLKKSLKIYGKNQRES